MPFSKSIRTQFLLAILKLRAFNTAELNLCNSANVFCSLFFVLFLTLFSNVHSADPTIVIHWSTVTMDGDPDLLKDRNGNPLSIGSGGMVLVTLRHWDILAKLITPHWKIIFLGSGNP